MQEWRRLRQWSMPSLITLSSNPVHTSIRLSQITRILHFYLVTGCPDYVVYLVGSLVGWCLTALLQHKRAVSCHRSTIYLVQGTRHTRHNNETIHMTEKVINALWPGLCEDNLLNTNRLPRCLSSQSFDKYWQPEQPRDRTHANKNLQNTKSGPN